MKLYILLILILTGFDFKYPIYNNNYYENLSTKNKIELQYLKQNYKNFSPSEKQIYSKMANNIKMNSITREEKILIIRDYIEYQKKHINNLPENIKLLILPYHEKYHKLSMHDKITLIEHLSLQNQKIDNLEIKEYLTFRQSKPLLNK